MENMSGISPVGQKKLKQTRLPFAILSPISMDTVSKVETSEQKKRKLSPGEIENPAAKLMRVAENSKSKISADENKTQDSDVIDLVDDSQDDETAENTSKEVIKIKLPFGNKKKGKTTANEKDIKEGISSKKSKKKHTKAKRKEKEVVKPTVTIDLDDSLGEIKPLDTTLPDGEDVEVEQDNVDTSEIGKSTKDVSSEAQKEPENSVQEIDLEKKDEDAAKIQMKDQIEWSSSIKIDKESDSNKNEEFKEPASPKEKESEKECSNDCDTAVEKDQDEAIDLSDDESKSDTSKKDDLETSIHVQNKSVTTISKPSTPASGVKRSHKKVSEGEKSAKKQKLEDEKQKRLQEREDKKRLEREAKEAQRLKEKQEREEKLRREKEEKEVQKRKEKEERDRKKQAELDVKNEEKRLKEAKKEEDRRKKEDDRRKKEEEEKGKQKKAAQMFQNFFVQKKTESKQPDNESPKGSEKSLEIQNLAFIPFQIKENMRLAPTFRVKLTSDQRTRLESILESATEMTKEKLYLKTLKSADYTPRTCPVTWPSDEDSQDIVLIDNEGTEHELEHKTKPKYRAKFLSFTENRRPAYYGTWRKKSVTIKPRRPFTVDTRLFDYEVDSDDEWEEEEPGESLHGSDDEKDKDNADDDYEVDNEFFVPHGHLSDEEIEPDGDIIPEDNSPEAQKAKLKIMQQEFMEEHKKKTEKIKPRLIGCIWVRNVQQAQDQCSPIIWEIIAARAMICAESINLILSDPSEEKAEQMMPGNSAKKSKITEDSMKELIRLVHGNPNGRKFLVDEFTAYRANKYGEEPGFQEFIHIGPKIKEIAEYSQCKEEGLMNKVKAWFVKSEVLEKYLLTDLPLKNSWEYTLKPKKTIDESALKVETPASTKKVVLIDDEAMPDLIRLVHGNIHNRRFLVEEFAAFRKATYGDRSDFHEFSYIGSHIKKIAEWKQCQEGPMQGKMGWFVNEDVLQKYEMTEFPLPNQWNYHLKAMNKRLKPLKLNSDEDKAPKEAGSSNSKTNEKPQPGAGTITKFAVNLKELKKPDIKPEEPKPKKRVQLLMSVARGEKISEEKKNNLISQFLQKTPQTTENVTAENKPDTTTSIIHKIDDDDVMIID